MLVTALVTTCAVSRATRPVLKIGLVGPFAGQYRYVGYDAMYAARLALREANAAGGVGGYSVELVAFDDQGTAAAARRAASNLVLDPQVISVIGHYLNETTEAAQETYVDAGLPMVVAGTVQGQGGRNTGLWCSLLAHLVNTRQLTNGSGAIHVQWITNEEYESVSTGCRDGFLFTFSSQVPPPPDVDIVLLSQDPVEAGETLTSLRESGWNGLLAGGPTLGSPLLAQVADPSGVIFASPYRWPDNEVHDADFAEGYRSLGPHIPDPGPFALTTFETTQTLLAAIDAVVRHEETPSRQTLAKYLAEPSTESIYIYRWTAGGTLELEREIALSLPPEE